MRIRVFGLTIRPTVTIAHLAVVSARMTGGRPEVQLRAVARLPTVLGERRRQTRERAHKMLRSYLDMA